MDFLNDSPYTSDRWPTLHPQDFQHPTHPICSATATEEDIIISHIDTYDVGDNLLEPKIARFQANLS